MAVCKQASRVWLQVAGFKSHYEHRHPGLLTMSAWWYLRRLALHSRMPSMMLAWLSASDITASSSVSIALV